jgi:hypothetical protein
MKLFCKPLLVFFILLSSGSTFSQINSDSLNKRIDYIIANDTSNIQEMKDLQKLGELYAEDSLLILVKMSMTSYSTYNNPDSALVYGLEALELAKKMNSKKDIADSYLGMGEVYAFLAIIPKPLNIR